MSARFGTDPFIWNWLMWLIARLVPRNLLKERNGFVKQLAQLSDPFVRAVDKLVGDSVAMRVEVDFEVGQEMGNEQSACWPASLCGPLTSCFFKSGIIVVRYTCSCKRDICAVHRLEKNNVTSTAGLSTEVSSATLLLHLGRPKCGGHLRPQALSGGRWKFCGSLC